MARLVFSMNMSLDGNIDHDAFAPGQRFFRHFLNQTKSQTGSIYGQRIYEIMRYWDEDHANWGPDGAAFAAAWRDTPTWVVSRTLSALAPPLDLTLTACRRFISGSVLLTYTPATLAK